MEGVNTSVCSSLPRISAVAVDQITDWQRMKNTVYVSGSTVWRQHFYSAEEYSKDHIPLN